MKSIKDIEHKKTINLLIEQLCQILVDTEDEEEFHKKSDLLFVGIPSDTKKEVFKVFGELFNTAPDSTISDTEKGKSS